MCSRDLDVALIGFQDQGNLGIGYLAAVLKEHGYSAELIDVRNEPNGITARLMQKQPLVVGFSLIFQAFLPLFRHLATHLRDAGINSHFTIGGHFPSLCHEEVLALFPELDSVVRYEGEYTLLEMIERLAANKDWQDIQGIAYSENGQVIAAPLRPLIPDLDSLPYPYRQYEADTIGGFFTLPLLASRGCVRRCSFCSINKFYRTAPGKIVRIRKPAKVVEEMLHLERHHCVRIFLFQDDDFPIRGVVGRQWAAELAARLHESGLASRAIWKISCRAEYVEPDLFSMLRDAGLFLVYLGIESGVQSGLDVLSKEMTVEQNLSAVETLKQVRILFGYGFMLFDPSSTFESIRENIGFLRLIVGDGSAAGTFSRMLPYGGTPIRDQLQKEGRLHSDVTRPDYLFLDPRINDYHRLLSQTVRPWIHGEGISYQLNYAWDELETVCRLVRGIDGVELYRNALRSLTKESNERLFQLVEDSTIAFESGDSSLLDPEIARTYCDANIERLIDLRNRFIADNIYCLRDASKVACKAGPTIAPQVH